jgi:hypothetical protein
MSNVIRYDTSKLDQKRYDLTSFVTDNDFHSAPDSIHLYNHGQMWGNDNNDSAISWPEVSLRGNHRVRLSFYYRYRPIEACALYVRLSEFGHVTPDNYNLVGQGKTERLLERAIDWKYMEFEYVLDAKTEAVAPAFDMIRSTNDLDRPWRGEAWIDDVKVTIIP